MSASLHQQLGAGNRRGLRQDRGDRSLFRCYRVTPPNEADISRALPLLVKRGQDPVEAQNLNTLVYIRALRVLMVIVGRALRRSCLLYSVYCFQASISRKSADAARKELEAERRAGAELRRVRESLLEAATVDKQTITRCGTPDAILVRIRDV